ncbi:MAG: hypothetical protein HYU63_01945, partial [Armatimonadetes bacterium]|nr:hypothetical protein [Armatimonadota bacterium]
MTRQPLLLILFFLLITLNLTMAEEYSKRIISLSPSTTELLYSLNLEKNIIAVSNNCNYPPA